MTVYICVTMFKIAYATRLKSSMTVNMYLLLQAPDENMMIYGDIYIILQNESILVLVE